MIAFAILLALFRSPLLQMGWDGNHMDGWGWGGWLAMSMLMVLFWGGVVAAGILLVRWTSTHSHAPSSPSALDIARERFARGEISDEEFQRIKAGLSR
ncbi:MAG: SHOCT domain-containing protein [Tepidiformaceae bacterium]